VIRINQEDYWKLRAEKYNNLRWVREPTFLNTFLTSTSFKKRDIVLDVGTGTGVIAHAIGPLVSQVIGLDISQDMLKHCNWRDNKYFIKRDIREPLFCDKTFDKVTARMVFHHIVKDTQQAMDECFRVLKSGGKMVLSEGVPPAAEVRADYEKIFKLKEERITFLEEDLVVMMKKAGFKNIRVLPYIMKSFSIKDWLDNSGGLSQKRRDTIFEMHVTASDQFKKAYKMKIVNGDCLINVKNLIVLGKK
jgi:ubiquinone/menaquinone biosynthesis C-methylase UbiE